MSWNCFSTKLRLRTMVSAFALLATAGGAGTVQGATLEEAIAAALVSNPDVGVVRADRRAVQQELRQARALWLPSVDVTAATGPEYTDNEFRNEDLMTWESRIALRQLLFDGFATQAEVDRQLARVDSSARRVRESSEAVALDAVEAYLDVIRQQAIVREAQINIDNHSRILGFTRDLANQGRGGISDVRQVESRLATAQATFAQANGDLADAKARFQRVVGIPIGETEIPEPPEGALPLDAEQAAALAREASPTVEILRSDLDVARANLRASRSGYYPEFTAEVGASANHNIDGVRGRDNDAQALLRMNYNLFRGGGDVAREREAFARVEEAKFALEQAQRDSEEQARLAFNALTTASNETVALRDGVTASRRTRDAYREEFQLGQRRLLDLLTAENELFLSRTNLVTSEIVEDFAVYQILANTGQLLETLEIDTAPESVNIFREPPAEIDEPLPGDDQIVSNDLQAPPGAEPVAVAAPAAIAAPLGTAEAPPVAEPARADASTPAAPAASAGDESEYDSFGSFWAGLFGGAAGRHAAPPPPSPPHENPQKAPA
ncbi:MAG: TolC family outer membrane protein, partial [Geminicoccaceae bacterium]